MPLFFPHFDIQKFNTLAVPAIARYFVDVQSEEDLREAMAFAKTEKLPLLVLGGGSNIVLRTDFFPGLIIHMKSRGLDVIAENEEAVWLRAAAGENWHHLVTYALGNGYYGLENLSLIPGSVGAAPIQNIGAYGVELKDVFSELTAVNIQSGLTVTFNKESCRFGYRDSIFKQSLKDQYVITTVTLKLRKVPQLNLNYPALRSALGDIPESEISPEQVSAAVVAIRQSKLPDPEKIPNVGSFFKNPVIPADQFKGLKQRFPGLVSYPVDESRVKLAAGWLIDQANWRGREMDGVRVHAEQALVLTNPGKRSGAAVLQLAARVVASVKEKFGVDLEMEPRVYPE